MSRLDREVDASMHEIERRRKTKLTLVIAAMVLVAGGMLAMTSLMYSSTPGQVSQDRIGEESFM